MVAADRFLMDRYVENVITFTAEAIYQPPAARAVSGAPAWGPASAVREWDSYTNALGVAGGTPRLYDRVLADAVHGSVQHAAVGWRVIYSDDVTPDPQFAGANLTDGLTGRQTPWDPDDRWVAFPAGRDATVTLE